MPQERQRSSGKPTDTRRLPDPVRIIPCLDVKDGRVVKGIHFVDLRDAGDPVESAVYYQREGADQLTMLDIAATLENRKTRIEWAKQVTAVIDIPLLVGGGITDLTDAEALFKVGVSAVSVGSAAVARPEFIKQATEEFGSHRLLVAIDGRRNEALSSGFEVMIGGGRKPTGLDAVEWAQTCEARRRGTVGDQYGRRRHPHRIRSSFTCRRRAAASRDRFWRSGYASSISMKPWSRVRRRLCWRPLSSTSEPSPCAK